MGFWNNVGKLASGLGNAMQNAAEKSNERNYQQNKDQKFGNKSISEWDREWRSIGILSDAELTQFNKSVGLYKALLNGRVVYIGRAVEFSNGGFRKRLSDYRRQSDSARTHGSGQKMNEHNSKVEIELLEIGGDFAAAELTKQLEKIFIGKYRPEWNKQF